MSVFLSATAVLWAMLTRYEALVAKSTMVSVFLDEVGMKRLLKAYAWSY